MFAARLQLTFLYSFIFLLLFWTLSSGIYFWMNKYFGDAEKNRQDIPRLLLHTENATEPSPDAILDELRNIIIVLDSLLLFGVPTITWILTGRTLAPVEQAHEREKIFFTNASHDLRTPLSILQGNVEVALRKNRTNIEYKKILQSNKEEINHLIAFVEDMLFFARYGNQFLQKELVDLPDLLAERLAAFSQTLAAKNISLTFTPPKNNLQLYANAQLLKRLFTTLIDNAIKYNKIDGKITLTLKQEQSHAYITISDNGIGISKKDQEKIFDRFFRADTSRSQDGYGLGLPIAKEIMHLHNGTIHVASQLGKGTKVTVVFPLSKQDQGRNLS